MKNTRTFSKVVRMVGILVLAACVLLGLLLARSGFFDTYDPVKEKARMERNFQLYQPIIDALPKYREKQGWYPDRLEELIPDYIDQIPQPFGSSGNDGTEYHGGSVRYRLILHFGTAYALYTCEYQLAKADWECYGGQ
jgi:hypothetical protein